MTVVIIPSPNPTLDVYNSSAEIGFGIDVEGNIAGFFNHSSSRGILVDYESECVVVTDFSKVGHKLDFPYNTVSLLNLYEQGEKISKEEADDILQKHLIALTAGEYTVSALESWDIFIHISRTLSVSLKRVAVVLKTESFTASTSLNRLVEIVNGFTTLGTYIEDAVKVISEKRVVFSLKVLLNAKSALEIGGYIWEQLRDTDLKSLCRSIKTSVDVLHLVSDFSTNSTTGVNGLLTFLSKLVHFAHGQESLHIVTEVLVEVIVKNKNNPNLVSGFRDGIDDLHALFIKRNFQDKLKAVYKVLVEIRNRKWIESGVNVTGILKDIDEGLSQNSLKLVIRVLNCLKAKTSIELAISTLVLYFVELLTVRGGAEVISVLVGFRVNQEILEAGPNALTTILRGVKIPSLWSGITTKTLAGLPVIGPAVGEIDVELKASGIRLTVEEALESSASGGIKRIIIEVIEVASRHLVPVEPLPVPAPGTVNSETPPPSQSGSTTESSDGVKVGFITSPLPLPKDDDQATEGSSEKTTTEGGDKGKRGSTEEPTTESGDKGKGGSSEEPTTQGGDKGKGGSNEEATTEGGGKGKGNGNEYGEIDINGLKGADGKEPSDRHKAQGRSK